MQDDFLCELVARWMVNHPEDAQELPDGAKLVIDSIEVVNDGNK